MGAGLRWNFPYIAQGDFFQTQVNYTQGALAYLAKGDNTPNWGFERGENLGFGTTSDCVIASTNGGIGAAGRIVPVTNPTGCNLTSAWQINASYEHYWTPQFHESFFGGITELSYDAQANAYCARRWEPALQGTVDHWPLLHRVVTTTSISGSGYPPPIRLHQDALCRRGIPLSALAFGDTAEQCTDAGELGGPVAAAK